MHASAGGSGQVSVLQQVSLQRRRGWVHIKPHSHCICLMLCGAHPSRDLDLWLGLEPAKWRIQDLAWICLCIYIMTEKANSLQANMSQNKNTMKVSWAQQWEMMLTQPHVQLLSCQTSQNDSRPKVMRRCQLENHPPTPQLASQNNWSLGVWHSAPGTAAGHSPATEQYQGLLIKFSNRNTVYGQHCHKS